MDPHFRVPNILQGSLQIEREILHDTVITLGTTWTHGVHLASSSAHDLNLNPQTGTTSADDDDASVSTQLDIFNFSTPPAISIADVPTIGFGLPEIREAFGRVTVPTVPAHGPPLRSSPGLRAPPA